MTSRARRLSFAVAVTSTAALALTACGGSGFEDSSGGGGGAEEASSGGPISVLIGSSGAAETEAVTEAVKEWSDESGVKAEVQVASDLNQQLSQGFASGEPADVFYLSTDQFVGYAANGSLEPYAEDLENADKFYEGLREAFTYEDEFYCAPKDFSTLALVINTGMWKDAGLTDADIPTTWDELRAVSGKLTTDKTMGLAFSPEYQRVGAFSAQAGGGLVSDDGTEATVNSAANVEALSYVKSMMKDGIAAYSSDLGAGWGGEAFGKGMAAMTIEGNWIAGAMSNDFPKVDYQVAELPAGPEGMGTLQYTNCLGIAADSDNVQGSVELVQHLTSEESQMEFAESFGVMPSVESLADQWKAEYPKLGAFIDGADYAQNLPSQEGAADVIAELNAQLATLESSDPQQILDSVQQNMQAVVQD
ncbi:sugar ABC transporter substrate-binding protein [Arthrobacter sp. H14]|uniref:sugar ABC transporter substrate-binding protein n=1 Tax=Arthrobacter sp. H14 TaxID=1312959 RepID=UPI00047D6354|nr:extracellular solute-binding protein [Arthrobacter sp. H14]